MNIPDTMKALVLMGPDRLDLKEVPVPTPGPQEVLIRVESCAICSTDVALIHEPFPHQPPYGEHITGHEYSGTIAALGATVDEFQIGDRVAVEAHLGCGRCRNCRLGDYTSCLNYGNTEKGRHRCFSKYLSSLRIEDGPVETASGSCCRDRTATATEEFL